MQYLLRTLREIVEKRIPKHGTHGFEHTERVYKLCKSIGEKTGADMSILLPAALLHDIARGGPDHAIVSAKMTRSILNELLFDSFKIDAICEAISTHSFSGGKQPIELEAMILSDADKLDAMGAVGIYRAAMYSGEKSRSQGDFIAHFHEKLLKLKVLLFTETARALAEDRHRYMIKYLKMFDKELS